MVNYCCSDAGCNETQQRGARQSAAACLQNRGTDRSATGSGRCCDYCPASHTWACLSRHTANERAAALRHQATHDTTGDEQSSSAAPVETPHEPSAVETAMDVYEFEPAVSRARFSATGDAISPISVTKAGYSLSGVPGAEGGGADSDAVDVGSAPNPAALRTQGGPCSDMPTLGSSRFVSCFLFRTQRFGPRTKGTIVCFGGGGVNPTHIRSMYVVAPFTLACPTQQHTNKGPARALGRCEAPPCVFARVVSRSALSARAQPPDNPARGFARLREDVRTHRPSPVL